VGKITRVSTALADLEGSPLLSGWEVTMKPAFFVILLFSLLVACAPTAAPTLAPTSAPTATIAATLTPIPAPTETLTPTSSPTPTIIPTLPVDAARARLLELLADNGGCRLPCLWGITPGKSSNHEARKIMMPLGSISTPETTYFDLAKLSGVLAKLSGVLMGVISPLYVEGEQHLNSQVGYLYGENGIVSSISFRVLEEKVVKDTRDSSGKSWHSKTPIFDLPTFRKRVEYYSLSHVLSEQGMPDSVMVHASGLLVGGVMDIALLYPNQGIWVNYTTKIIYNNGVVKRGCPANSHIDMFLFPPGDSASFFSLLDQTDWGVTKSWYVPLEKLPLCRWKSFIKPSVPQPINVLKHLQIYGQPRSLAADEKSVQTSNQNVTQAS
jgi:hypothetical protein